MVATEEDREKTRKGGWETRRNRPVREKELTLI